MKKSLLKFVGVASALATAYRQVQADAVRWRSLRLPRLRLWRIDRHF